MELPKHTKKPVAFLAPGKSEDFPKKYDAKVEEKKWQEYWEKEGIYKFDKNSSNEPYVIDTPPPTVSGDMHIGHAFSYSQQDFIARFWRMNGFNVYYPFGTDDNGLPTERLVEKLKKVKSTKMERPDFVNLCRETLKEIKPAFILSWKNIGMSCDFSNPYSTIDPHCVKTSQKSFLDLYKKEHITRHEAPSMWCVKCQTAIAQAELEDKMIASHFNDVTFKLTDKSEITIGTTRPELLPACVCIFVHPKDEKNKKLIGQKAIVPLFEQEVEIFADESADPEKGSGILMICSYGDRFDVDAINRKKLEPRVCFTKDGKLNDLGKQFSGMNIKDARKAILEELEIKGLLTNKKDISHAVNVHDKCGTEIEFLATKQWFIKVMENKELFLKAGEEINWYPKAMKSRYDNWVQNLNWDWCISRQRHFGVPFPIWYDKKGKVILADESELPVDPLIDLPKGYSKEDLTPEKDVMDTWATSSMTPQIITNWVKDSDWDVNFETLYPTSLRPQAHDIIRTWAFYTIVKGIYHENKIPWKNITISGNVADPKGEKMSKSKGNVVDPKTVIDKYSSDALRFWAAGSKLGEDLAYQEKDILTGQKMVTKLFNASKFALMHLEDYSDFKGELLPMDKWLLSKLNKVIKDSAISFEKYEYSKTKAETEKFFWQILCDNYMEIVKDRLYNPNIRGKDARASGQYTLYTSILGVLKLMAPIMPHITESVYQMYFAKKEGKKSIHISDWPVCNEKMIDAEIEETGDVAIDILSAVRKYKSEQHIPLNTELKKITIKCELKHQKMIESIIDDLKATTKSSEIEFGDSVSIPCDTFAIEIGIEK